MPITHVAALIGDGFMLVVAQVGRQFGLQGVPHLYFNGK